ncbi:MAG: bifunctional oligoribonuclease/PAP phosphatase NrnA [Bacteroidaceae bacterium]|nr:bifunctional oligoribonuclease/PAP phosphatase NrnA [Bacteroidaceae bacterium]
MIENAFSGSDVSEFRFWMGWADRYVILTHMGPDGDAIGSSLALCHYLRSKGKQAVVLVPDSAPDFLKWLPGADEIKAYSDNPAASDDMVYKADVLCCLDFNVVSHIGNIASAFLYSKAKKFLLDHHPFPGSYFDVILSHPEASSTSELVFHLICALGDFRSMDLNMAECIYTGIMTDTGALSYNSNNSSLFNIVSHLLDKGVDKDDIYRRVYNNYSEDRLRLQGFVLCEKMQVFRDKSTSLITLTDDELRRFNYKKGDTEGFVNMPLQINGVLMSAFFREDKEQGIIKLSFRSVGDVPCNRFSSEFFHGGGHINAAGGEFNGTLSEAVECFLKGLDEWSRSTEECIRQLFVK